MSIAYVTTTFPTFAWFIENEVAGLRSRGERVRVFTLRRVGKPLHRPHEALVPLTTAVGSPLSPAGWIAVARWLARRPGVLVPEVARILWASRTSLYALIGHLGYLPAAARVASMIADEGIEHVHGAWAHFPGTVAYLASRLTGARFSIAAHAGTDLYRTRAFLPEKLAAADFVLTCVQANAQEARRLAPTARVEHIAHGVDLQRFDGRGRRPDPEPMLLAGGRLSPEKGLDVAIHALAELERRGLRTRLVLIGDGPARGSLDRLGRRLGVSERVEFHGRIAQPDLIELFRRAWVLVSPCRVMPNGLRDGIPNLVTEGLAMGVPCVTTSVGGLAEVVVPGQTGAIFPQDDSLGLADALEALLRSPSELKRMGMVASALARRELDATSLFERVHALFQSPPAEALRPHDACA